ncbi:MAG: ABC transporter ATP-binding protein [bacterium]|nr:ABC transporter ATP-binding protein [bacterium]
MQDPLLQISNLNVSYVKSQVLQSINLIVHPAELVVVIGPNNAGKTTLLKSILGLPQVARMGSIRFNKREIIKKKTHKITKMGVGYVPQGRLLFPSMTVDEHLRFTWQKYRKKSQWTPEIIYELFPELEERMNVSGTHLSGGEQKMVAIGQALVSNPTLLLDEPSEGLSISVIQRMEQVCHHLKSQGIAILLVEQNLEMVRTLADRAYFFETGQITHEMDGNTFRSGNLAIRA